MDFSSEFVAFRDRLAEGQDKAGQLKDESAQSAQNVKGAAQDS